MRKRIQAVQHALQAASVPQCGDMQRLMRLSRVQVVPDLKGRASFTCGPEPWMAAYADMMEQLGFDMAGFHQESFAF